MIFKALALAALLALPATAAIAGPAENQLLARYEGEWRGTGKVTGPDPGTVVCRLTFKPSSAGKLGYTGRCSYSGSGTASFRGTIAYNDAARAFEASSSAQGASMRTVGKRVGGSIVFASANTRTTHGTVSSIMTLASNSIKLGFTLVDRQGRTSASSINFQKR
jgi:hypothetical protein